MEYTYPARRISFTSIADLSLIRMHLMESCYNMASKFIFDVHMNYPDTTKDKSPLVDHPLRSIKGVDGGPTIGSQWNWRHATSYVIHQILGRD